jgi:hypothetical protein
VTKKVDTTTIQAQTGAECLLKARRYFHDVYRDSWPDLQFKAYKVAQLKCAKQGEPPQS